MFHILSSLFRYLFIFIIYYFVYTIIRLIYLDITTTTVVGKKLEGNSPYIKLVNRRESLPFPVEKSYFLEDGALLGRSGKNMFVIKDPFLSGSHVRFLSTEGHWYIHDLNSKNGTMVNHVLLEGQPRELQDGDLLHVGQLDFLFVEPRRERE